MSPQPEIYNNLNYLLRLGAFLNYWLSSSMSDSQVCDLLHIDNQPLQRIKLSADDELVTYYRQFTTIDLVSLATIYRIPSTHQTIRILAELISHLKYPEFSFNTHSVVEYFINFVLPTTKKNENLTDNKFSDTFRGTRRALRHLKTPEDIMNFYISRAQLTSRLLVLLDTPASQVIPFLSGMKTFLHNNADFLKDFRFYMDLGNLAGYPAMADRELSDDPVKWLSTPSVSQYDQNWWADAFFQTYSSNATSGFRPRGGGPLLTYDQYVLNRWMWSTNGATKYGKATLDGERVKTKFSAALSISDAELLEHAYLKKVEEFEIGVFIKPDEMGFKRRLIANVSLGPYIMASYIRYVIEHYVTDSPLFLKLKVLPDDKVDVIKLINNRYLMLPLDESAYDYHVSRESWLGFIEFLKRVFPDMPTTNLFEFFFNHAFWRFGELQDKWLSGMPSGLALTSFLNSWMNYIKQTQITPGYLAWAAGDDVCTAPFDPKSLEQLAREYAEFGSSLNATKNWYSSKYTEYLKTIYHSTGSTGYPARIYASLIWAGVERTFLPSDRLPELSELFKQFFDRLGQPFDDELVAQDLARSVSHKVQGFNKLAAKRWLHSPKAYGGFGLLPYNDTVFEWEVNILRKKRWENVLITIPEINFYGSNVVLKTYNRKIALGKRFYYGEPLRLPMVSSLSEWEARLNGDDNPVKGRFKNMAQDVIPLPTVNGISTSNMSAFAERFNLYVYPQLRGDTQSVIDRLIVASLALLAHVETFMRTYGIRELAN